MVAVVGGPPRGLRSPRRLPRRGEARQVDTRHASIYEYWAGFLWGGFEYPLSKSSAVYQVVLGATMLVVISTYTANLAVSSRSRPADTLGGVLDEAMIAESTICALHGPFTDSIQALYPRLPLTITRTNSQWDLADQLVGDGATAW